MGAAAVVALAAAVGWWWRSGDEAHLRRRLLELAALAGKSGAEPWFESARRAEQIAAMFDEPFSFDPASEWTGAADSRSELKALILHARTRLRSLRVEVSGVETDVDAGRTAAVQRCAVAVEAVADGVSERQVREAELRWRKTREGWRIAEARAVDVIRPLAPATGG